MVLRSGCDWHPDPDEHDTIERYLRARGQAPADVEPIALDAYTCRADDAEGARSGRPGRAGW